MAQDANHLIWLDMEMSGLDPDKDKVLELAIVVTDSALEILSESPAWVIHQPDAILDGMDAWNQATHRRSGLIDRVRTSVQNEAQVAAEALAFVKEWAPERSSPMCGNSICQDRRFMARHMPQLEAWFHYRNLDVSTLKDLCRRWRPDIARGFEKKADHTALADIRESILELRYYREYFLRLEGERI